MCGTWAPRPLVLNTWEAVYFDHDLGTLERLIERAARVGVERVVLDDGWFGSRRDATRGLGDWFVSPEAWPDCSRRNCAAQPSTTPCPATRPWPPS